MVGFMAKALNDNDTWTRLGLAAARVLETCEKQKEDAQRKAEQSGDTEQKREEQRAYIEQRLRDIAKFEESFRPGYRSRRKRI